MAGRRAIRRPGAVQIFGRTPGQPETPGTAGSAGGDLDDVRHLLSGQAEAHREVAELAKIARGIGPEAEAARLRLTQAAQRAAGTGSRFAPDPYSGGSAEGDPFAGIERRSDGPFELRFDADGFGPGDEVHGILLARAALHAGQVEVELGYMEETDEFSDLLVEDSTRVPVGGVLDVGAQVPFTLQLPVAAAPNWRVPPGQLYWTLAVKVDVPRGRDIEAFHALPLRSEPGVWSVPAPATVDDQPEAWSKGLKATIVPDRGEVRRGDVLTATVTLKKPADSLQVGLVCRMHYEDESSDRAGTTQVETVHEQWQPLEPVTGHQVVHLQVPRSAPFSYGKSKAERAGRGWSSGSFRKGSLVAYQWTVVVKEDRRMRRDPRSEVPVVVAP